MDRATDAWGQGTAPQSAGPTISPITLIQHPPSTTRCNAPREHSFNLLDHFEDPEAGPSASPTWGPKRFQYIKGHAEWASIRMAEEPFFL